MSKSLQAREPDCLVLQAAEVAKLLDISVRHLWTCNSSGRLGPRPIKLGRVRRWRVDEVHDWIKAGAPPRDEWDRMRKRGNEGQQRTEETDG